MLSSYRELCSLLQFRIRIILTFLLATMSSVNQPPLYADTPLALLATPAFLTGKVGISVTRNDITAAKLQQKDHFTLGASYMTLSHNCKELIPLSHAPSSTFLVAPLSEEQ
jgi:hypothetical protein